VDTIRNWTERNKRNGASVVWHFREVSTFIRKFAIGFFVFSVFLPGLLFSAETAFAEESRIPKEPPTILSHTPETDATQVPVNGVISVVWDRPMHPDTNFTVTGPEGFVTGAFLYDPDTYTVTFLPDEDLTPDTRYGVLVTGQVDMDGQIQQTTYQWNFNTVTPTSVSIVSFGSPEKTPLQNWLWSSWPWLMLAISVLSLAGFLVIWGRRRLTSNL